MKHIISLITLIAFLSITSLCSCSGDKAKNNAGNPLKAVELLGDDMLDAMNKGDINKMNKTLKRQEEVRAKIEKEYGKSLLAKYDSAGHEWERAHALDLEQAYERYKLITENNDSTDAK